MELVFYSGGRRSIENVSPDEILKDAAERALKKIDKKALLKDYCVICNNMELNENIMIGDQKIPGTGITMNIEGTAIFLVHNSREPFRIKPVNPYCGKNALRDPL